jgi:methylglyoxal synthase
MIMNEEWKRNENTVKITLALIAHDNKKTEMVDLVKQHSDRLSSFNLVATHSTGKLVQAGTGLAVTLVQSGPLGGDQQIGSMVASGIVKAVIFLRDPLTGPATRTGHRCPDARLRCAQRTLGHQPGYG